MPHSLEGFRDDQKSFASVFSIRGYEVGPDRRASIVTIANLLQVRPLKLVARSRSILRG